MRPIKLNNERKIANADDRNSQSEIYTIYFKRGPLYFIFLEKNLYKTFLDKNKNFNDIKSKIFKYLNLKSIKIRKYEIYIRKKRHAYYQN